MFFYTYVLTQTICIQLGSNIGDRAQHLKDATSALSSHFSLIESSPVYETEAWGLKDQQAFYNQLLIFESTESPYAIHQRCISIEEQMGRQRDLRWGPRIIDLDIIFYSNKIIFSPKLQIPHLRMQDRRFVLKPLVDIAKSWIHPVLGKSAEQLLQDCNDNSEVKLIPLNGVRDSI